MTRQPPPRTVAYCNWHRGLSDTARLVRLPADQGSGSGTPGLFACARCRQQHDLTPLEDQP